MTDPDYLISIVWRLRTCCLEEYSRKETTIRCLQNNNKRAVCTCVANKDKKRQVKKRGQKLKVASRLLSKLWSNALFLKFPISYHWINQQLNRTRDAQVKTRPVIIRWCLEIKLQYIMWKSSTEAAKQIEEETKYRKRFVKCSRV